MKVLGFVEGAVRGGFGLVGVPMILSSVGHRGHRVALVVCGSVDPGRENLLVRSVQDAYRRNEGCGSFGIVTLKAWTAWAFAPAIWRVGPEVKQADIVSLHSLYSFPVLAGYLLTRLFHKPYCVWPHGVLAPFQRQVSPRKKSIYDRLFVRRMLNGASLVFYSADGEREEAANLGLTAPSMVVPHGIAVDEYLASAPKGRFRAHFLSSHEGPLVIFLARLNAKKGLRLLIEAMSQVVASRADVRLAIIGPPDPPSFLRQVARWVEEFGIGKNTVLTGAVGSQEKHEALSDADVFVLPSEAENFGFSIFEAMASRIPVVVSDTLNYSEEIARSGAGLSVPRLPQKFAEAIHRLLDDPGLRMEMGEKGLLLARKYSWEENGRIMDDALTGILKRTPMA